MRGIGEHLYLIFTDQVTQESFIDFQVFLFLILDQFRISAAGNLTPGIIHWSDQQ